MQETCYRQLVVVSHSQQCPGGLALRGSPSVQQDHLSLGPQGDQGHPKRKRERLSHTMFPSEAERSQAPLNSVTHSFQHPKSQSPRSPHQPLTDLCAFLSSCARQSLLSRRPRGAGVTPLTHGAAFSCGSLRKGRIPHSALHPTVCTKQSSWPPPIPPIPAPKLRNFLGLSRHCWVWPFPVWSNCATWRPCCGTASSPTGGDYPRN